MVRPKEGLVPLTFYVEKVFAKELQHYAVDEERALTDILETVVQEWWEGGDPPQTELPKNVEGTPVAKTTLGLVFEEYQKLGTREFRRHKETERYIQLVHPEWPVGVHYEFLLGLSGKIGVEIHLERETVKPLAELLSTFESTLALDFPEAIAAKDALQVRWSNRWCRGLGRLRVRYEAKTSPATIAKGMQRLIEKTFPLLDAKIKALAVPK